MTITKDSDNITMPASSVGSSHLLVAIDFGGSLTKVVASLDGKKIDAYKLLTMTPHCVEVTDAQALKSEPDFDEKSVWLKIGKSSYAVGNFAQAHYSNLLDVQTAKTDTAVQKTCAVIAVLAQVFGLPVSFNVTIACVLPPGELSAKEDYKTDLVSALKDLTVPSGKLKPRLLKVNTLAEGQGVLNYYTAKYGLGDKTVVTIMSGFRNTSLLLAHQGQAGGRKTSGLGFYRLLQEIEGGYDPIDLIAPVSEYRATNDPQVLRHLLKSTKNPDRELERLVKAIEAADAKFVGDLSSWIKSNMPPQVDAIVGCGGTFDYLERDLDTFLVDRIKSGVKGLYICKGESLPNAADNMELRSRFADIYYVWHGLHRKHQALLKDSN